MITNKGDREIKRLTYSIIVIGIVFASLFWGDKAHAQTRAEYDQIVAEAQAKVSAAQEALLQAQRANEQAIADGQQIQINVQNAQNELLLAQQQYETALILDPNWIRPTKEVQVAEQIPHTIQVPHTEIVTETTLVPRTVTTVIPGGLTANSYNMQGYNNAPPLPGEDRLVSTQTVSNINFDWGGGQILNSGRYEDTIVKFTGYINTPSTGTYVLYAPGDDGIKVLIDGETVIDDWYDKGGGGSVVNKYLTQGQHTFTLWFYENGGGANVWFYWTIPGGTGLEIVPASAFGEQVIETIVYDEVTTTREVTTYTEEIIYETVWHTETVLDMDAIQPEIQDPALLLIVNEKQNNLDTLTASQIENSGIIESTSNDVLIKKQELDVAQSELEAIPPFRELPPTPTETQEPTPKPTEDVVQPLPGPDETSTPEEPATTEPTTAVEQAQEQLSERAAENDTGVLPYTLADAVTEIQAEETLAILSDPSAMATALSEGVSETIAFVGELFTDPAKTVTEVFKNVSQAGLDMSDDQREKAQEVIVPVVIVSQIASMMVGRIK